LAILARESAAVRPAAVPSGASCGAPVVILVVIWAATGKRRLCAG
jgi:hypothetical protein